MTKVPLVTGPTSAHPHPIPITITLVTILPDTKDTLGTEVTFDEFPWNIATRCQFSIEQDAKIVQSGNTMEDKWPNCTFQLGPEPSSATQLYHRRPPVSVAAGGVLVF